MIAELFINVAASVILLGLGFAFGKFRERQLVLIGEQDAVAGKRHFRDHAAV